MTIVKKLDEDEIKQQVAELRARFKEANRILEVLAVNDVEVDVAVDIQGHYDTLSVCVQQVRKVTKVYY